MTYAFHPVAISAFCLVSFLLPMGCRAQAGTPASRERKWDLAWSDEFGGSNGSGVDPAKWVLEVGGGNLEIQAQREKYKGQDGVTRDYTSARLKTLGKFSQTYGRFEAGMKIPYGQGLWPAFWMMGDDIDRVVWPACGEIDIMENVGKEPSIVHGTIHGPGYSGAAGIGASYTLPTGKKFADDFHIFAVEWEPNAIRFYVDGNLYETRTRADLPQGRRWVFDHPFFLLMNVAVGGSWPRNPDTSTVFPQTMLVDFVRVYRRSGE